MGLNHDAPEQLSSPQENAKNASMDASLSEREPDNHMSFPDGGWRAWSVVLGSWCAMVPSFGLLNTIGVLQSWLADHQLEGYSKASIGWIFSVYTFFLYFGSVQVGPIFDTHGLGPLLVPGCVGLVGSLMIFSVAEGAATPRDFVLVLWSHFSILLRILSVHAGVQRPWRHILFYGVYPSVACIAHWFLRRRALATGIAATAGGIGGIIIPVIISNLSGSIGFPWAIRVIGFISAVFCALSVAFLRTRLPTDPVQKGKIDIKALREPCFALLTIAIVLIDFALLIPLSYLPSYAQSHGVKDSLAFELSSIINAASIFGRIVPGYFADRFGRFNVMILTTIVCSAITLALWLPSQSNLSAILAFSALFGFWSGSAISLAPVCVAQISKTEEFGKRYGTTYCLVSLGTLLAIPVSGEILKANTAQDGLEDYSGLIIFCGLIYFCSSVFFILSRGVAVGWRWEKF